MTLCGGIFAMTPRRQDVPLLQCHLGLLFRSVQVDAGGPLFIDEFTESRELFSGRVGLGGKNVGLFLKE